MEFIENAFWAIIITIIMVGAWKSDCKKEEKDDK